MLKINNLIYSINKRNILNNISFIIPKGKITAFVGNNGAGKTTTIKCILNQIIPDSGEVLIDDKTIYQDKNLLKLMFFPDLNNIILNLTGSEYLKYYQLLYGLKDTILKERIKSVIQNMKIESLWNKKIKSLSSGEKKQIIIAITILLDRECIILDEPTANLDVSTKQLLLDILIQLNKEGKTVLITSHIIEELQSIADHLVIIDNGQILYNESFNKKTESILQIFQEKVINTNNKIIELIGGQKNEN